MPQTDKDLLKGFDAAEKQVGVDKSNFADLSRERIARWAF
jgi:hypothetical protein